MSDDFKIPFFKSQRNSLALHLFLDADRAKEKANKAKTISEFIENYDIILDRFKKLSLMNGKVTSVKGDLQIEFWRLETEFQKHFYGAIDRSGDQIIKNRKGLYKYDDEYIKRSIKQFGSEIEQYFSRGDGKTQEFAKAKYRYVCYECGMPDLINETQHRRENFDLDIDAIIKEEENWRRQQQGIAAPEDELSKVDLMNGPDFEHWCAKILGKNGFEKVAVTPESGDQGVDVLAEKDGIKYAIQCKCYSSDLGNTPIQEVNAGKAIYRCHIGVVMTNRFFTSGAKEAAEATGVLLWDRNKLKELINSI